MIFVNFKTYKQGSGSEALKLVTILERVSKETSIKVIPVVQVVDLKLISQNTKLEVWVQHVDPVEFGAHTGYILPEAMIDNGAVGTFLNHSEHKFSNLESLSLAEKRAQEVGLKTLVFAGDLDSLKEVAGLNPTYLAYEPPELVGSTTSSVASSHPDVIGKAAGVAKEHGLPLVVGAGVHSQEDVRKSLQLGALGVAVATNIVKSDSPERALKNLLDAFQG
jgi:triosephosphate isomerase